ncbi:2-hydroxyacid dehydrogenase [Aquamicrobium sp. LC103]|uniref:2-hydroxyacid dehydrogenase n=1 Tax=Aquamicrobium sp. LC103 TaxID=1120658 RepID=UPI00063EC3E2|nr:2-hydroxyacid dehydrogenase [Aquamicrobium sp. LC103]TKT77605.1 2-hydroxyacid dehydrogenase [Aquamicrobium sp. LC103]
MASAREITVLIPGKLHPQTVERLEKTFKVRRIDSGDPALVDREAAETVRGIASSGLVNAAFIDAFPNLEIIANFGVGYDAVDAAHAAKKGIMVTNTPDVLTEEVADTAIGLLLNAVRELPRAEAWLRAGNWVGKGPYPLTVSTLRGRSVGVLGMGRIGLAIARRLEGFGVPISYHNRREVEGIGYRYFPTLRELAENVDTLISVAPGGAATAKIVNAEILEALGPDGVFINIGRGSTVDEDALASALADGTIRAAGLDVFADEPKVPEALLKLENAVLLPHVGSASQHTRDAMGDLAVDNLVEWFEKRRPITPVFETAHVKARD